MLMKALGGPVEEEFSRAAAAIQAAQWPRFSSRPLEERQQWQRQLPQLRPTLKDLGVLASFPDDICGDGRTVAQYAIWPGASFGQSVARLEAGIAALREHRIPNLVKVRGIAAGRRKPVGNELHDLQESLLSAERCVQGGDILEGEMLRAIWNRKLWHEERTLLENLEFDVVTTDEVPPEALHGRPTNLSTLFAWRHKNPHAQKVVIFSIAPYGYRFWCEAMEAIPDVWWELIAPVPEEPNVAGAISEVGKIVYNLAKSTA